MRRIVLFVIVSLMTFPMKADEGMWFLMFIERLNHRDMQKMGLQLTAEEIYSINNHSLKDAIVQFNGGCTAEIISKEGLVLTNHHCGYSAIAELSSVEKNYLKDGFWAKTRDEEIKPSRLSVRFFVRMGDVSSRILSKLNDSMTETERETVINKEISLIEKENSEGGRYIVSVKSFFQGNEYYFFIYQDYTDVRLVGTPPESLGKFGGDTDNWEWPRQTADFSVFRVYADENGNPAEYSKKNVPLKPKHYLPINLSGQKEGDFAMILGYPGKTNRWMPASGIEQNVKFAYPAWVEGSKTAMDCMKKYMDQSKEVSLVYASKYARIANYWKNRQGMIDALTKFTTSKSKASQEEKFNVWANKPENKDKYGKVVESINKYYSETNEIARHDMYLAMLLRSSSYATISGSLGKQLQDYAKATKEKQSEMKPNVIASVNEFFKDQYLPAENEILATQLNLYATKATGYKIAPIVSDIGLSNKGDYSKFVKEAFETSIFTSPEKIKSFLDNPNISDLNNDVLMKLSANLIKHYNEKSMTMIKSQNDFTKNFRLLVEGLRESKIAEIKYPDANSTLRLTYGKVRALPADKRNDAKINNYTTIGGMVKKYKKGDSEFDLPERLLEMNAKKDYGRYKDKDGTLHVNFLTDNDITGGNSGSPVLNGKGELVGIAFDGNIEAMAGDVIFDKKLQRTINCDIRFILWVIDNFSGAKNIVDEMTLVQ